LPNKTAEKIALLIEIKWIIEISLLIEKSTSGNNTAYLNSTADRKNSDYEIKGRPFISISPVKSKKN